MFHDSNFTVVQNYYCGLFIWDEKLYIVCGLGLTKGEFIRMSCIAPMEGVLYHCSSFSLFNVYGLLTGHITLVVHAYRDREEGKELFNDKEIFKAAVASLFVWLVSLSRPFFPT